MMDTIDDFDMAIEDELEETCHRLLSGGSVFRCLSQVEIDGLKISDESVYSDNKWVFNYDGSPVSINFDDGQWCGFLKQMAYCILPQTSYSETVRSIYSTKTMLGRVIFFIKTIDDIFRVMPNELGLLTESQIKTAFNSLIGSGTKSHPLNFLLALNTWNTFSEKNILSKDYCSTLDNSEFEDELGSIADFSSGEGWQPIETDLLNDLWTESKIWIDGRGRDIVKMYRLWNGESGTRVTSKVGQKFKKFTATLENEKPWYKPEIKNTENGKPCRDYYNIMKIVRVFPSKLRLYATFIILLLTGIRIRELLNLERGCCTKSKNSPGSYELKFRQFKVAEDPEFGEWRTIPVPRKVYKAISLLGKMASINGNTKYLFENKYSGKKLVKNALANPFIALGIHPHQCRKTISWLLISRDEDNVDLLRELLGHASYAMTLMYIVRNPELVEAVKELFKEHYTKEFSQLVLSIAKGSYSGPAAERIAKQMSKNGGKYDAQTIDIAIEEYIRITLESGSPIFLKRIPVGGICIAQKNLTGTPTPCTADRSPSEIINPIVTNCKYEECVNTALTEESLEGIEVNIIFYERMLSKNAIKNIKVRGTYEKKLRLNLKHRDNLLKSRPVSEIIND